MGLEKDLELISKICAVKDLEKWDIDCTLEEKEKDLFTLARLFVSYDEFIHFEDSIEGAVKFLHWICGQLYTRNDSLYSIKQMFIYNKTHEEFVELYEKFYTSMYGREMDKEGLYTTLCGQIALRYNLYSSGHLKL